MPAAGTRACIATRLCSFQSICCPCVELRCLSFSPSPQLSSQLSELPWLLGCAFSLSLLPSPSLLHKDEHGQGWLIYHHQCLWCNPGGTCNPCNPGGSWEKMATQYPLAPWNITHVSIAKVTFFSLRLSYGSGESTERPTFPERVTDTYGGCYCTLRVLISEDTPHL